ncbi:MAG: hypothetical protein ACXVDA_07275, partial [Ktedonobacterales bacterium]
ICASATSAPACIPAIGYLLICGPAPLDVAHYAGQRQHHPHTTAFRRYKRSWATTIVSCMAGPYYDAYSACVTAQ